VIGENVRVSMQNVLISIVKTIESTQHSYYIRSLHAQYSESEVRSELSS
jgi:hypothetical protein